MLIRYSAYPLIDDSFKTPIQATTTTLNTVDGLPKTALGMTALHLRIADFKFIHNFIICERLPDTEIIFGINVQKKFSLSYAWDKEKNCYIQKDGRFLTYTQNCKQMVTIGIVKSTLKIPLRHNVVIPIKIKGHSITGQTALFISNQESTKGKDPNINIVKGIHIKGRTSVNILVSNYINKYVTFNKGEYIGHLEHIAEERYSHPHENSEALTTSIATTKKMMSEQVELDTFQPLHHKLKPNIKAKLAALLKEYESQFAQDETSIGTTPLTKMSIDTGKSEPVSQKPYPIAMRHYQWVKDKIEKIQPMQSEEAD